MLGLQLNPSFLWLKLAFCFYWSDLSRKLNILQRQVQSIITEKVVIVDRSCKKAFLKTGWIFPFLKMDISIE